jgi:hypothetical protein
MDRKKGGKKETLTGPSRICKKYVFCFPSNKDTASTLLPTKIIKSYFFLNCSGKSAELLLYKNLMELNIIESINGI